MEGGPSDPMEEYVRQRSAFQDGQAQVEGLVNFIKERVAMEENYAKSLTKLSKHSLSIDGANLRRRVLSTTRVRGDRQASPSRPPPSPCDSLHAMTLPPPQRKRPSPRCSRRSHRSRET
jgi:hypothetical protein